MRGVTLRRQQRHSHQPNAPQGSDAPVSLVFRTHGDNLSKAAFLFCPKNFNLANPVAAARQAPGASADTSAGSASVLASVPSVGSPIPPSSHHVSASSPQLTMPHEGKRGTAATLPSVATESVQTLVEAIVELRPFSQPLPHSQGGSGGGGGGGGGGQNASGLAPVSPLVNSSADGATAARSFPGRTPSIPSVKNSSHADVMGLSSVMFPTSAGSFGGGDGASVSLGHSLAAARSGEYSNPSAALARSGASSAANVGSAAPGGASGINASMLGNTSYSTSPISSVASPAAGAGSGGAGSGGGTSGGGAAAAAATGGSCFLMHPSGGWICRAMAFNEKEVSHANGAISVSQSLTSKCVLINEVAKGKVMARILSSYQDVQRRYGLSHVEVTVVNQYLSRSDMFLISEALRERILYEGEETHLCGFRIRVREMLQSVPQSLGKASTSAAAPSVSSGVPASSLCMNAPSACTAPAVISSTGSGTSPAASAAGTSAASVAGANTHVRVGCGIVLPNTRINFQSLSPVYYILLELSSEMWETAMDGRIALTLAIRKFLSELLLKQLPKRKASPLICVVFTGRLKKEFRFGRHSDVFHMLELPRELRNNVDIVEEIRMHCEALVQRVLREFQETARQKLEAECLAYREAATAFHSVSSDTKSLRGRPANDTEGQHTAQHSLQETGMSEMLPSAGSANQLPTTSEALQRSRAGAVFPSAAGAVTENALEAYLQSRQRYIDSITVQQLFVHAKQSNTLEALSILLERCTHNYIDRNLTLCGHAVTVVSAGKGFYQVTNNLVQVVCARLHDIGLEKVHVVCIGRPPLHATPLLEYTSLDDTLRSQYHLHSYVPSGATAEKRRTPGRVPASSVYPGEVGHYYETPEWMSVLFFNASLQNESGGETVFELLPKECWQRQHSVLAALKSLWPALPQPQGQTRWQQQQQQRLLLLLSQSCSVPALSSGGAVGGGGEEDGSSVPNADAEGGIGGRGVAATALDSCGNPDLAAEETSLACCHAPLLIPGLGLRSYPMPEVTLPVHVQSPDDALLYAHGLGGGAAGPQSIGVPPRGAGGLPVAASSSGFLFGKSHVPVYPQSCTADLSSVSWTGSISAEPALSPSSPLGGAKGKVATASRFGTGAPLPTVAKCSSPLLVRSAMASSMLFTSSAAALTQGSFPHGATGTCTLAFQGTTNQQAQMYQGLKPTLSSHTVPTSCSYSPLLQHAQYVQPVYTFNSAMFPGVGALGSGISGSETTPASVAAATVGGTFRLRRLRTGSSTVSGAVYRHLAAPDRNAGQRTRAMLVATTTVGSSHPHHPNSLPSYYANRCNPGLQISLSFDHKTTANPEQHSFGAFEHSVRSIGSSLLCRDNSVPHQATKSLRGLDGSPKSSMNSIVTSMTAAAGTDTGVSRRRSSSGSHRAGGGLRPVQLRLEDGHVYRDVMTLAVSCASCAWYCLHASKPHQENVSGAAPVSFSGSSAPTSVSATLNMAARQECGSGGVAAVCVSGGSSLLKTSAMGRGLAHREERPRTLNDDTTTALAPGESSRRDSSLRLPVRSWHKASSSTRSDAVFCGCNVVDSDLRSGYLILEITINAAVLPRLFWSPLLVLNDSYWAHLMSCFTGRDDRLTLDEELEFPTESDRNDDDMLTISGSSTDGLSLPLQTSGGRGGRRGSDGGLPGSSAAAPAMVLGGPKEASGGTHGGRGSSGAGGVYHFQSVFRPTEVFCRSHSGITPDGRTLIIPTHSNSLHFQSPEELLLRVTPHLFVSAPDEGGEVALGHLDPAVPGSPRHGSTSAVGKEAMVTKAKAQEVFMVPRQLPSNLGGGGHTCVAAAGVSTRRQRSSEGFGEGNQEVERVLSSSRMSVAVAAMPTPAAGSGVSEIRVAASPHPPDASLLLCNGETARGNSTSNRDSSFAAKVKGTAVAVSPTLTPLSSSSRTVDALESLQVSPEASVPVTLNETLSRGSSSTPQNGSSVSGTLALPTAQSRPLRLPPVATTTGTPIMPAGAQPLSFPHVATMPVTSGSGLGDSSIPGPLPSSLTQDAAMQLAEQLPGFGTLCLDEVPLMPGTTVTVGFVQLRDSLLFAIKPINPLRQGSEEEQREDLTGLAQPAESVSTATVLRRRWQWKHPDVASELPNLASWTRLCTCRLLPLYGSKPAYPPESFYSVSPHQYTVTSPGSSQADAVEEKRRLLEFVLQRLQQQYQLVVDSPGLAAGSQWPRADVSPNARLEMSLGHQTHTLKLDETVKTISVTRMLHRGMYSNGQVTHMLSYRYLLWNYLADDFSVREVHMEAQVGERNAFRWEALDRWLQERPNAFIPRGLDVWMRSREVAVVLLPEDAAHPPSYEEFCRFIGYRFSVHLSTHGKVTWKPHRSPVSLDISGATPLIFPAPPQLMDVVLVHDNPTALDTRNVIDRVTGRTVAFDVSVQERFMSVDISLPQQYHTRCCYFLRVSWLACAASIVMDWIGSFIANASRFHFHAVPVGCYYHSPKTESLTAHYDVEAASLEEEPALRRSLIELLLTPAYRYYADTPVITRNCRLVHDSGLCYVIVPPSARTVAQWYQNTLVRQGSVEQLELLALFKGAVATARQRAAYIVTGDVIADSVSSLTTEPF